MLRMAMKNKLNLKDPSLLLTPHPYFRCNETTLTSNDLQEDEEDDDEIGRIKFSCTVPLINDSTTTTAPLCSESNSEQQASNPINVSTLHFRCRDQSVGFLNSNENSATVQDDDHEVVDPNFFDAGYTLAGRTGFQIWAGSRVMMEGLLPWWTTFDHEFITCSNKLVQSETAYNKLKHYQDLILKGAKILELGSGVGIVGASLASIGAQVLLTDLQTLVDYSLWPNLTLNSSLPGDDDNEIESISPSWLGRHAVQIHKGWASTTVMDWSKPLKTQLSQKQINDIEIIISCDCVWLVSMLDGLLDSVSSVFESSKAEDISFLMSFQRRDTKEGNESSTFTTVDRVLSSVEDRGWKLECLAWRPVTVKGDDNFTEEKEVFVFEIKP